MGYTTDFDGQVILDKTLTDDQAAYLRRFSETRRMQRDAEIASEQDDPLRIAVGLPIGPEGCYFVGDSDASVTDCNHPSQGEATVFDPEDGKQPGLWCQWTVREDNDKIGWDGGEKFYHYVEWMRYIINNFLAPWGYVANGEIAWRGEDIGDVGIIIVDDNDVSSHSG